MHTITQITVDPIRIRCEPVSPRMRRRLTVARLAMHRRSMVPVKGEKPRLPLPCNGRGSRESNTLGVWLMNQSTESPQYVPKRTPEGSPGMWSHPWNCACALCGFTQLLPTYPLVRPFLEYRRPGEILRVCGRRPMRCCHLDMAGPAQRFAPSLQRAICISQSLSDRDL